MTTSEFWDGQNFSYITTYSFNRGNKLDNLKQAARLLFQVKRHQLLTAHPTNLPGIRAELRSLEEAHDLELLALTEGLATFHITASPVAVINKTSETATRLAALFRNPVAKQFDWMCWPVYRDALAFYNERGDLVGVLNICLGCDKMQNHLGQEIQADNSIYQGLKSLLSEVGHLIIEK